MQFWEQQTEKSSSWCCFTTQQLGKTFTPPLNYCGVSKYILKYKPTFTSRSCVIITASCWCTISTTSQSGWSNYTKTTYTCKSTHSTKVSAVSTGWCVSIGRCSEGRTGDSCNDMLQIQSNNLIVDWHSWNHHGTYRVAKIVSSSSSFKKTSEPIPTRFSIDTFPQSW